MASIERRQHRDNPPYWRVVWYQDGGKKWERFDAELAARRFRGLVEAQGNRYPMGWIPHVGFASEQPSTVPLFADYALRTVAARLRADEQTKEQYAGYLRNHVNPVLADVPVDAVDRFKVAEVASRMVRAGRSAKTVKNVHGFVSSVLDDAVTDGLISRNPARGVLADVVGVKGEDMVFLTADEFRLLEFNLPEGLPRDLTRLLVGTGLRWAEATALGVYALDLKRQKRLHVYRAWKRRRGRFELGEPKTRRSRRWLDLSDALVHMLSPYVDGKPPHAFVFETMQGHAVRHSNFYDRIWRPALLCATYCDTHRGDALEELRHWRNARERARNAGEPWNRDRPVLPGCHCDGTLMKRPRIHDLRHTHASWLIDDGISLPEIQRRLGHESIQTTIDRYGHPSGATQEINAAIDRRLHRD